MARRIKNKTNENTTIYTIEKKLRRAPAGGGGGLTAEQVDDRVASLLQAGAGITLSYNDGVNTLTIAATGGGGGDAYYRHVQASPSAVWTVTHSLGKYPSVTVVDSGGTITIGDVVYTSTNSLTITFTNAFSGEAYIN